ncbi:hypothetical protein [Thiosulfatihalobacter marinus]|uniref:hypothetical protein n=1 Tax=Thiosulfatihalobacter marinus TaxID=2792481 RepID=UPI0018D604A5|nr:hypothetical protein [Thiosulfatihalobacter marinus]
MALILIFIGSFIGIVTAAVQMLFQDVGFWQGLGTYLAFSFGFPAATGLLVWSLRPAPRDLDDFGWTKV